MPSNNNNWKRGDLFRKLDKYFILMGWREPISTSYGPMFDCRLFDLSTSKEVWVSNIVLLTYQHTNQ